MRPGRLYRCGDNVVLVLSVRPVEYAGDGDDAWVMVFELRRSRWQVKQWCVRCHLWSEVKR